MRPLLLAAALALAASPAAADVVELRNGISLEGEVTAETETMVTLRIPGGTVTFERKLVARIVKKPLPPPEPEPEPAPAPKAEEPVRGDGPVFAPVDGAPPKRETPKAPEAKAPDVAAPAPVPAAPAAPVAGAIAPARDDWTILWSSERRTGWCRAQAKVDPAGKSIFEWETTVLGKGGKPEGTIRYVEEAGPGLTPTGFLLATETPTRQFSRSGRVKDGRLLVEYWENGEKTLRDLEIPEGTRFPLAARALVLGSAGAPSAGWSGTSFDPRDGEFAPAKITLLRRERFSWEGKDLDTVVLARTLGAAVTEERVTSDGRVLQSGFGADGGASVGTTAAAVEALRFASTVPEASETEQRGRMAMACPEDGFRIRKPGVSWVLVPAESRDAPERAAVKDFSGTVGVVVATRPAPAGPEPSPADLGQALELELRKECSSYSRTEAGASTLGGSPSWRLVADTERNGDPVRILVHVLARRGRVYTVTATAPRVAFPEARPYLQRILDQIEWL
jgi:hypothetical protein